MTHCNHFLERVDLFCTGLNERDRAAVLAGLGQPLQTIQGKTFVVKYGGNAMTDAHLQACFAQDMVLLRQLGVRVVVVHGGGPQIDAALRRLSLAGRFVQGLRVTDAATMQAAQWVLCGEVQQQIVGAIARAGGRACGLCGYDGNLFTARKLKLANANIPNAADACAEDLGQVGELHSVDASLLHTLLDAGYTPVVSPIARSADEASSLSYNVNADVVAGRLAAVMQAQRLLLLTNIAGVNNASGTTLNELNARHIAAMIADGSLSGGMLPKLAGALDAAKQGVQAVHILDGRVPHIVPMALLTQQARGTVIRA